MDNYIFLYNRLERIRKINYIFNYVRIISFNIFFSAKLLFVIIQHVILTMLVFTKQGKL